jgi:hypothetical protein
VEVAHNVTATILTLILIYQALRRPPE